MSISVLYLKKRRGTQPQQLPKRQLSKPMPDQFNMLQHVLQILKEHRGRRRKGCYEELERLGFTVADRRHRIAGGVGSYYWLPLLRCYRVQVGASHISSNKKSFRYAPCIEIYTNYNSIGL